jgi:thiazole/oxazole-forming peptide maturase SagD family component
MNIPIRELLGFHSRFDTGDGFWMQYARSALDAITREGVTKEGTIALSETHRKLIERAQKQRLLHRDIGYVRALKLAPGVHYYDVGLRTTDGQIFSRGTSLVLDEAFARALGELYERVSMRFAPADALIVRASVAQLRREGRRFLDLASLPQPTAAQKRSFPEMDSDEDSTFGWVSARNLFSSEETLVPAQLAYWGYRPAGEPMLGNITTHGLGGGYTRDAALASAAGEVLQRHSFFSFWYARKAPPKISPASVLASSGAPASLHTLLRATEDYGFDVHLLDCTLSHGLPSVAVVLTRLGMGWFVGMSTAERYETAIERATCEALSTYVWVMDTTPNDGEFIFGGTQLASGFCDSSITDRVRILAWAQQKTTQPATWFLEGTEIAYDTLARSSVSILDALKTYSRAEACVVYAREPYLDAVGFASARVIAPHMHKLALAEHRSTPVVDGVEPLNTYPHPFP